MEVSCAELHRDGTAGIRHTQAGADHSEHVDSIQGCTCIVSRKLCSNTDGDVVVALSRSADIAAGIKFE
jgi:hypothetical protein